MGMTMSQKILAAHAGKDRVVPGEFIEAKVDIALANDITGQVSIREFEKMGAKKVFDRHKIALVPDHFTPNKDIQSAEQSKILRDFAREQDITAYFEVGDMGIEHALLPEQGVVTAGDLIVGADSHTCTYGALGAFSTGVGSTDLAAAMALGTGWFKVPSAQKFYITGSKQKWVSGKDIILHIIGKISVDGALYQSMEFMGPGIAHLTMDDRFAMANMAIEAGAKNGIFPVDDKTKAYIQEHPAKRPELQRSPQFFEADEDAEYEKVWNIDLSEIPLTVALPHLPDNTVPAAEAGHLKIDQVVIGSCTNGRMEDMEVAASILKGHRKAKDMRLIIIPATQAIYMECLRRGYAEIFIEAGAVFSTPTCGPCLGGHMGILAGGERAVATTNRNFVGRMGAKTSEIILASPAVAAASAITGYVSTPE